MSDLSTRSMERILKKTGAKRVSDKASAELKNVLEKTAETIAKKAWKLAQHAKRRTILDEDIKLASETKTF